jgi:hypothetical protein
MRMSLRKMPVVLMMVNLVVRTPESIVSFGFLKFLYKCNFNILAGKHLDMMYARIVQFYWMLNETCGRSNN